MADANPAYRTSSIDTQSIDQGLRKYMIGVYEFMMLGVALTGLVAWFVSQQTDLVHTIGSSRGLLFLVSIAPLPVSLYLQFRIDHISAATAQGLFWLYSALIGAWFGFVIGQFTDASLARVFLVTAASFGALSLYGYTTPRSLTAFRSFLVIGMVGIIIATLLTWVIPSETYLFWVCIVGVLVYAGLTAYNTQQVKEFYFEGDNAEVASKKSVIGALVLYVSFVAMFQYLLYLLGNRD